MHILSVILCSLISLSGRASQIKAPKIQLLHGKFSVPFFLTNGHQGSREEGESFVYVMDAQGKIVWEYFSKHNPPSKDIRTRSLVIKPLPNGRYGILHPYEASFFEVIDKKKRILGRWDLKQGNPQIVLHHDFLWRESEKIISIGNSSHPYRKWWKFWAPKNSFLGSPMMEIDFVKKSAAPLWDFLSGINPFQEPDWKFSHQDSGAFFQTWNAPLTENDFEHTNSIQEVQEQGFLLSMRSLNRLVFLDPGFKKVLWSIGPSAKNTYSTENTSAEFYRQHHATLLNNGQVMLFDNGIKFSRAMIIRRNEKSKTAELMQEFIPSPPIHSEKHGSVFELENGNILAYFPNTKPDQNGANYIIEFNRHSAREIARMSIDIGNNRVGYRAIPLTQY